MCPTINGLRYSGACPFPQTPIPLRFFDVPYTLGGFIFSPNPLPGWDFSRFPAIENCFYNKMEGYFADRVPRIGGFDWAW